MKSGCVGGDAGWILKRQCVYTRSISTAYNPFPEIGNTDIFSAGVECERKRRKISFVCTVFFRSSSEGGLRLHCYYMHLNWSLIQHLHLFRIIKKEENIVQSIYFSQLFNNGRAFEIVPLSFRTNWNPYFFSQVANLYTAS